MSMKNSGFSPFHYSFLEIHKDDNAGIKGLGRNSKNKYKQIKNLSTNKDRTRTSTVERYLT